MIDSLPPCNSAPILYPARNATPAAPWCTQPGCTTACASRVAWNPASTSSPRRSRCLCLCCMPRRRAAVRANWAEAASWAADCSYPPPPPSYGWALASVRSLRSEVLHSSAFDVFWVWICHARLESRKQDFLRCIWFLCARHGVQSFVGGMAEAGGAQCNEPGLPLSTPGLQAQADLRMGFRGS